MTIFGADLSSHNAGLTIADLQNAGLQFCTARAVSFPWNGSTPEMVEDPDYAAWRDEARALSFPFAAYCMFHTFFTPTSQAQFIASIIGDAGIPVLLDFEPDSDSPSLAFIESCFDACKVANLSPVPLYDPHWWWASQGDPVLTIRPWKLVSSSYGANPKGPAATVYAAGGGDKGWPGWAAYGGLTPVVGQFGSQIEVGTHLVDGDAFKGTVPQLIATGMFTDWGDPMTAPSQYSGTDWADFETHVANGVRTAFAGGVAQGQQSIGGTLSAELSTAQTLVNKVNALASAVAGEGGTLSDVQTHLTNLEAAVAQLQAGQIDVPTFVTDLEAAGFPGEIAADIANHLTLATK